MAENRFVEIQSQDSFFSWNAKILMDTKTGVNYLFVRDGYGGGLTVLVDREGKPIVTPVSRD